MRWSSWIMERPHIKQRFIFDSITKWLLSRLTLRQTRQFLYKWGIQKRDAQGSQPGYPQHPVFTLVLLPLESDTVRCFPPCRSRLLPLCITLEGIVYRPGAGVVNPACIRSLLEV